MWSLATAHGHFGTAQAHEPRLGAYPPRLLEHRQITRSCTLLYLRSSTTSGVQLREYSEAYVQPELSWAIICH
jgi:hypothetical protein